MKHRMRFGEKPNRLTLTADVYNVRISWYGASYTMTKWKFIKLLGEVLVWVFDTTCNYDSQDEDLFYMNFTTAFLDHLMR